jgi:uncharacterized membrane protein YccC
MNSQSSCPFDSIESAHGFVGLLAKIVGETKQEIDGDMQRQEGAQSSRRIDALRIASYDLDLLQIHLSRSSRILNDLRTLRRLLFEERAGTARSAQSVPSRVASVPAQPKAAPPVAA